MAVYVTYQIPVWVKVDVETERIVDVNIGDEFVDGPVDVHDIDGSELSEDERERAVAVAEESAWPRRTIGS